MRCVPGILLSVLAFTMQCQILAQETSSAARTADSNGVIHLEQNWKPGWDDSGTNWFHHASQGTMMLPYAWFMALEQPSTTVPEMPLFSDAKYLNQFGFIRSIKDENYNPGDLPIGFAITEKWDDPNTEAKDPIRALGLSCAACHTSEITYKKNRLRIEGGSAMINIGAFQEALGRSLFITNSSSQKFEAFAKRVLGPVAADPTYKGLLKGGLERAVAKGLGEKKQDADLGLNTLDAGFSRTDAFARIGNRVFGKLGSVNLTETGAPVNFPHLWDTPWFYWVQYNASIKLPMIRNIGEALGVGAAVSGKDENFSNIESTVNIKNLHLMEDQLAGQQPFTGLKAPTWPEDLLGEIQGFKEGDGQWQKGKQLYETHCIHCHFRIEDYEQNLKLLVKNDYWTGANRFGRKFMKLPLINFVDIGTDPAAAANFYQRIVYTGAVSGRNSTMSAVDALTFATIKVREAEYARLGLSEEEQIAYDGYRDMDSSEPGAIARMEYKARPLNGIWATAPFLHNGSVANLYELLLPAAQRMKSFYLGSVEFDPKHVGFETQWIDGGFRMDTTLPGNLNTGHEFRNLTPGEKAALTSFQREKLAEGMGWAVNGVLGPELSDEERWALIEYLKSLGSPQPSQGSQTAKVIGQEYPPANEAEAIQMLGAALGAAHKAAHDNAVREADGKPVVAVRGQHPKQHGAVWARFHVEPNTVLPRNVQVGLFSEEQEYTAIIRFSNGDTMTDAGTDELGMPITDVRGMAIKVLIPDKADSAKSTSQDFVTANHEVFLARDVADLLGFLKISGAYKQKKDALLEEFKDDQATLKGKLGPTFMAYAGQLKAEFPAALRFKSPAPPSPLQATYWSQTPYKLGPHQAVKYVVVPSKSNPPVKLSADKSPDFLKQAMVEQLTDQKIPTRFDFCIQLQTDADRMLIEDPTVPWTSPRIKVATITIYPQRFDSDEQMKFSENLSFSPWTALEAHAPLGGINRARNPIYEASSKMRHDLNGTERKEPSGRESF